MVILETTQQLKQTGVLRACTFVPTMGSLHEGHLCLIQQASALAKEHDLEAGCVVSIFVNPAQFDEKDDFDRYPRLLEADAELAMQAGASIIYAPAVSAVYPENALPSSITLPTLATDPGLEDRYRPGHLQGVARVLERLFNLVEPCFAIFGEKDWQQLLLAQAVAAQCPSNPTIVPGSTIRESDGLAMSSRNKHLDQTARTQAGSLSAALRHACNAPSVFKAHAAMLEHMQSAGVKVEYATIRHAHDLSQVPRDLQATQANDAAAYPHGFRVLVAARVGTTRLIDNAAWPSDPSLTKPRRS